MARVMSPMDSRISQGARRARPNTTRDRHSSAGFARVGGRHTGHDGHAAETLRDPVGTGQRVRAAGGDAQHGEAIDTQLVGEAGHVIGPVEQPASPLKVGEAEAGAVGRDDALAVPLGRLATEARLHPRAREAVEVKDGAACGIADDVVAERATVRQREPLRLQRRPPRLKIA